MNSFRKFVYSSTYFTLLRLIKKFLHNSYLAKLYQFNKKLFIIVTGFFLLTLMANIFKAQAAPFFIWGMFSGRAVVNKQFQVVKVTVNDTILIDYTTGYPVPSRFYLSAPVNAYVQMKVNNNVDKAMVEYPDKLKRHFLFYRKIVEKTISRPEQYDEFIDWYRRYIQEVKGIVVKSMIIELIYCHYDSDQNILKNDSSRIINESFF